MKIIPNAPKYSTCWYCHDQVEGSHEQETLVRYDCPNHKPLRINWYCTRKSPNEWYFYTLIISLPKHYELYCNNINEDINFKLAEWKSSSSISGEWRFTNKYYPLDWVLTQTSERLLSLFQMYKTFS